MAQDYESEHTPCYDRGDDLRRSSTKKSKTGQAPRRSETLYKQLWRAKTGFNIDKAKRFIPFDTLELARSPKLVEQALQNEVPPAEIPGLVNQICYNSFFRIFATLVLCEKVSRIRKFVQQGLDDSYLPFPTLEWGEDDDNLEIHPHKHSKEIGKDKLNILFKDKEAWRQGDLDSFNKHQWWTIAPFFHRQHSVIPHYVLEANDVLPFTEKRASLEEEVESLDEDVKKLVKLQGGFGDVYIVNIHPAHYDFESQPYSSDGSHSFALKSLRSPSKSEFLLEVKALSKYNYGIDQHFIPLLATIEKEDEAGKYYLLFPKANGDLRTFWRTEFNARPDKSLLRWMAGECLGIANALSVLHKDQDQDKGDDHPIYGRHGDIKAANILWFSKPGIKGPAAWRLVLSDFGLMRFHRAISISAETASKVKKTLTYQAPEFEITGAKISRKSDIWALGCMYLEFATCCVRGYQAVDEDFPSYRGEDDPRDPRVSEDKFYKITDSGKWAELKPKVRDWISDLRQDPKCSRYLHDFLDLIEHKMLCIGTGERAAASEVADTLKLVVQKCGNDSYLSERSSRNRNGKLPG
ncbi:kinase-like protein [Hypoxylon sp. NC1633]|nr:kinase-like protein [Hypoxylon sp. NC1633]